MGHTYTKHSFTVNLEFKFRASCTLPGLPKPSGGMFCASGGGAPRRHQPGRRACSQMCRTQRAQPGRGCSAAWEDLCWTHAGTGACGSSWQWLTLVCSWILINILHFYSPGEPVYLDPYMILEKSLILFLHFLHLLHPNDGLTLEKHC